LLQGLDITNVNDLLHLTGEIRSLILAGSFPEDMQSEISILSKARHPALVRLQDQ
jgi:hypothetical protein